MCGRFTLTATGELVSKFFGLVDLPRTEGDPTCGTGFQPVGPALALSPRYNIAPTQPVLGVLLDPKNHARMFQSLRWGLIPSWAKDSSIGARMINARAETVAVKPAYRSAFRYRRCLIAADGFYEWQQVARRVRCADQSRRVHCADQKMKQPYYIRVEDGRPFAFAGLWEHWEGADGSAIDSCTVITTEPNELVRPLHNRMPVILRPEYFDRWLDPDIKDAGLLHPVLVPYPADRMAAYPVSTYVNDPSHDNTKCVEPL